MTRYNSGFFNDCTLRRALCFVSAVISLDPPSKQESRDWDRAQGRPVGKRHAHRQVVATAGLLREGHQEVVVARCQTLRATTTS